MTPKVTIDTFPRGWGFPGSGLGASRKAHYFVDGMSLCRKWGFFAGRVDDGNHDSPDNCAACKRLYKRDLAPKAAP